MFIEVTGAGTGRKLLFNSHEVRYVYPHPDKQQAYLVFGETEWLIGESYDEVKAMLLSRPKVYGGK